MIGWLVVGIAAGLLLLVLGVWLEARERNR